MIKVGQIYKPKNNESLISEEKGDNLGEIAIKIKLNKNKKTKEEKRNIMTRSPLKSLSNLQ